MPFLQLKHAKLSFILKREAVKFLRTVFMDEGWEKSICRFLFVQLTETPVSRLLQSERQPESVL